MNHSFVNNAALVFAVLVKFDKPLRGPRDEAFRDLSMTIGDRGSGARFLLADVNVQGKLHDS